MLLPFEQEHTHRYAHLLVHNRCIIWTRYVIAMARLVNSSEDTINVSKLQLS